MHQPNNETAPAASALQNPEGRSTAFRAVEGGTETRSGPVLLIEAYAAIWLILMIWLVMLWNKSRAINGRLDRVEKELDAAAARSAGGKK